MRAGLPLPPGDIYNLTVTACTERSRNTSTPSIIKLGQHAHTHAHTVSVCVCARDTHTWFVCVLQSRRPPGLCTRSTPRTRQSRCCGARRAWSTTTRSCVSPAEPAGSSRYLSDGSIDLLLAMGVIIVSPPVCQAREPLTATSHVLTVSGLMPSSTYNCTVTSFSYSTPSTPAHIAISTVGGWRRGQSRF